MIFTLIFGTVFQEAYNQLNKTLSTKWEFVVMQAEEQVSPSVTLLGNAVGTSTSNRWSAFRKTIGHHRTTNPSYIGRVYLLDVVLLTPRA